MDFLTILPIWKTVLFSSLMYLLYNYFFLSLIKLFIKLCCMFFYFSSSFFLSPLIILVSVKNLPFWFKKPLFMRFYICQKPSVLENPSRCFGKSVTCKNFSFRIYVVYQPTSKTVRFSFEGMSKTVLFSSVRRCSLHLHSVECKENSKALKKGTF